MGERRKRYPSDVTDEEWAILGPLLYPERPRTGRPPRGSARCGGCELLRAADRLPVAVPAGGLPEVGDGVLVLQALAGRRHLGARQRRAAAPGAGGGRARSGAERRDRR